MVPKVRRDHQLVIGRKYVKNQAKGSWEGGWSGRGIRTTGGVFDVLEAHQNKFDTSGLEGNYFGIYFMPGAKLAVLDDSQEVANKTLFQ